MVSVMKGETPDAGVERVPSTGSTPETDGVGRGSPGWGQAFSEIGILPAVRRQLEALEDWVKTQLARQQQQSEILIQRSLQRMEARTQNLESEVPRLEMSAAQLKGGVKGLADEYASQAKRVDALETRQWEWRQTVEENLRARITELERQLKNCATNAFKQCASLEEVLHRQSERLEALEERHGGNDLGAARLTELEAHAEVVSLEIGRLNQAVEAVDAGQANDREEALWEQRAVGVAAKLDPFLKELNSMQALAQEQDVKLNALRVSLDVQEQRTQSLADRLEDIDLDRQLQRVQEKPQLEAQAAAELAHAEQWLHSEDEPVKVIGFSTSGHVTPRTPRTQVAQVDAPSEGGRELLGLSENVRMAQDSEEDD